VTLQLIFTLDTVKY